MSLIEILSIAVGLSMDAVAVSLCAGAGGFASRPRPALRIAFHFGLFQGIMPLLGWLAGVTIEPLVGSVDHWLAFLLLAFVAGRMIRSGLKGDSPDSPCDPTRGSTLVMLSIATSIDAMAVGFSLAMVSAPILLPALAIGLVTFVLSLLAARLGHRLGQRFGSRMEIFGGMILLLIGLRILLSHLNLW
ncbi:MAG: manganese efflux pump [Anaerolineales bacterium]|nr:manganese efflux pump [Anaerolineales bacterium]